MDESKILQQHKNICFSIEEKRVKDALEMLDKLISLNNLGIFRDPLENLDSTYSNMLKYTLMGIEDPERDKIYHNLLASILKLADQVKQYLLTQHSSLETYRLKRQLERDQLHSGKKVVETIEDLYFNKELNEILQAGKTSGESAVGEYEKKHRELLSKIFSFVWLSDPYQDAQIELIRTIRESEKFPWYDKCVVVSALTLSLLRNFEENKVLLLIDFIEDREEQVWQRALIGLIIGLYPHDKRLYLYPKMIDKIKQLKRWDGMEKNMEAIIIQLLKAKETEKITKKLHDEILPEVAKLKPRLEDKLDLDNMLNMDFQDEKNPDWERVFEDSPDLMDKLQEFSQMQMEGADVFMSTFSMLKHFDFFQELSNWFTPFYYPSQYINDALHLEQQDFNKELFLEGLAKSPFMCNSDKYSFCLNVKYLPEAQKSMLLRFFNAELEGMNEIAEQEELTDLFAKNKTVYTQYLQDIYRFFKLSPLKTEFQDIFRWKLDIYNTHLYALLVSDKRIWENIAEFYFERKYYEEALDLYLKMQQEGTSNNEIFQKTGFCYQQLEQYEKAVRFYEKAGLFDENKAWTLKKTGYCMRKLKRFEEALHHYREAEKIDEEDLYTQASIGHCYIELKDYETALKYYFKVEYLDPANKKVLRPIAWCYFVQGKFEDARKYYLRLKEHEFNAFDHINLGHVEWCLGNKPQAVEQYKSSMREGKMNWEKFTSIFEDDKPYLIQHGMKKEDLPLILDYIKYELD